MKRILAMLLVACLILSLSISVSADGTQHNYSTTANSGIRHEVCTTLLGTSSDEYYIGAYTYDTLSTQSGTTLLASLRTLMTSTHTRKKLVKLTKNAHVDGVAAVLDAMCMRQVHWGDLGDRLQNAG